MSPPKDSRSNRPNPSMPEQPSLLNQKPQQRQPSEAEIDATLQQQFEEAQARADAAAQDAPEGGPDTQDSQEPAVATTEAANGQQTPGNAPPEAQASTALAGTKTTLQAYLEKHLLTIGTSIPSTIKKHLTPERLIRLACTAFQTTPALQKCSARSILACLVKAAEWGLELGAYGVWLVPFNTKCKDARGKEYWEWIATPIPDYRGMVAVARRSGEIGDVQAECVYECELANFRFENTEERTVLRHQRCLKPDCDHGERVGVWARFIYKDGSPATIEFMTAEQIAKVRRLSKQPDGLMWGDNPEEAWKKTVLKRGCKDVPMSWDSTRVLSEMIAVDNAVDQNQRPAIDIEAMPVDDESPALVGNGAASMASATKATTDRLREQLERKRK